MKRHLTALTMCLLLPAAAGAQHQHPTPLAPSRAFGNESVVFETSCAPEVAARFNLAVALLHSFWFSQAIDNFEQIAAEDSSCAMAHWGIALSHWGNPFGGLRAAAQLELGGAAIEQALAIPAGTPRERAYIEAVAKLFSDNQNGTQRERTLAYEKAMEGVVSGNPDDLEARIFYALAVNQTALPTDQSYSQQIKAAGILEPLFAEYPTHPGLAHYIIHAFDHPPLAEKALVAARRYASLAPAVPHALHMPSHTFTRVGAWQESIETNQRSAEEARRVNGFGEELHALDYQAYAYLQLGMDSEASAVRSRALELVDGSDGIAIGAAGSGAFAVAAIPARFALERGAWTEAAALPVRPANTPYTEAMTHFARALGAARSGHPGAASDDVERLATLRDELRERQDAYWMEQVDIQRRIAMAWVAFAEGRRDEGLALMREAADSEDRTDKAAVSPGPLAPARELLGYMLLEAGQAREALVEFEATVVKEPNRFRGLYGAGRAAELAGNKEQAVGFYRRLVEIASDADTDRPELRHARAVAQQG
ncbi:MAG: hypothetical protein AB7F99_15045 [Vicinamibacterales bacterium]